MSLKQQAVSGVKWNVVSQVSCTIIHLLRLAILTRLLDKSDFGLIAVSMMVISFTEIFSELGMTVGIIHKQNISENQYSSIFWVNVMMSGIVFSAIWMLSPLLAKFYNEPILKTIIPILGIQVIFNAFGKMFQTVKSKNLEFGFISKVRILSTFVGFILAVTFAVFGWGIYSLVCSQVIQIALNQSIYAIAGMGKIKIRFHFSYSEISEFIKIGTYRLGAQVLDFVSSKLDVFLIGHFFGMGDLGIYNIAKDLISRPYTMINSLVGSVGAATFAKIQNQMYKVKDSFSKVVNLASFICLPVYIAIFIFSDAIVNILYAPEYFEVAIFLRILAFVGIESSISSQTGMLQIAFGRTDLGLYWTIIRVILSSIAIITASFFDIYAVAYGQLIIAIMSLFIFWRVVVYTISEINFTQYINMFKEPLLISVGLGLLFFVINLHLENLSIKCMIAIGYIMVYLVVYYIFRRSYLMSVIRLIKSK